MEPPLDSHVFDAQGALIAVFNTSGSRHVHARLDNISLYARLATIDVEDRHFYAPTERGFEAELGRRLEQLRRRLGKP